MKFKIFSMTVLLVVFPHFHYRKFRSVATGSYGKLSRCPDLETVRWLRRGDITVSFFNWSAQNHSWYRKQQ
jgi:hypothetical protein